jgi:hypothetical protein
MSALCLHFNSFIVQTSSLKYLTTRNLSLQRASDYSKMKHGTHTHTHSVSAPVTICKLLYKLILFIWISSTTISMLNSLCADM